MGNVDCMLLFYFRLNFGIIQERKKLRKIYCDNHFINVIGNAWEKISQTQQTFIQYIVTSTGHITIPDFQAYYKIF